MKENHSANATISQTPLTTQWLTKFKLSWTEKNKRILIQNRAITNPAYLFSLSEIFGSNRRIPVQLPLLQILTVKFQHHLFKLKTHCLSTNCKTKPIPLILTTSQTRAPRISNLLILPHKIKISRISKIMNQSTETLLSVLPKIFPLITKPPMKRCCLKPLEDKFPQLEDPQSEKTILLSEVTCLLTF